MTLREQLESVIAAIKETQMECIETMNALVHPDCQPLDRESLKEALIKLQDRLASLDVQLIKIQRQVG